MLTEKHREKGIHYALTTSLQDEFGKKIHLDWLEMTDDEFIPLLAHAGMHHRKSINLNQNKLTNKSLQAMAKSVEVTGTLCHLRAHGNLFTHEGLQEFVNACPSLLSIDFPTLPEAIQIQLYKRRFKPMESNDAV